MYYIKLFYNCRSHVITLVNKMITPDDITAFLEDNNDKISCVLTKIRSCQVHEINKGRKTYGEYHHLFPTLRLYPNKFKQYLRMNVSTFDYLMNKVEEPLSKKWGNYHTQPILPAEQMVITLR